MPFMHPCADMKPSGPSHLEVQYQTEPTVQVASRHPALSPYCQTSKEDGVGPSEHATCLRAHA